MDETVPTRAERLWPFILIVFPSGIMQGFLLVVFPFLAEKHGVSGTVIGSIVGLGMLAVPLKVLWTPVVDLWLSLKAWVVLGTAAVAVVLVILLSIPPSPATVGWIAPLVLAGMISATFAGIAGSGMLALALAPDQIGRGAGYWQGGALVSQGIGGGAMLWAATHGGAAAALVIGVVFAGGGLAVLLVPEPVRDFVKSNFVIRLRVIGVDLWSMASSRRGLYVILLFLTPIGVGAASNIWGGFANEWGASAGVVAFATGLGFGLANTLGSFLFGFCADHMDRVIAQMLASLLLVGAAVLMVLLPRTPMGFTIGALVYGVMLGCAYTTFTALSFEVVGKGAAASKMGILNAIGNVPLAYMSPLLGLVHDRWSTSAMLWFEAWFTLLFMVAFMLLRAVMWRRPAPVAEPAFA